MRDFPEATEVGQQQNQCVLHAGVQTSSSSSCISAVYISKLAYRSTFIGLRSRSCDGRTGPAVFLRVCSRSEDARRWNGDGVRQRPINSEQQLRRTMTEVSTISVWKPPRASFGTALPTRKALQSHCRNDGAARGRRRQLARWTHCGPGGTRGTAMRSPRLMSRRWATRRGRRNATSVRNSALSFLPYWQKKTGRFRASPTRHRAGPFPIGTMRCTAERWPAPPVRVSTRRSGDCRMMWVAVVSSVASQRCAKVGKKDLDRLHE